MRLVSIASGTAETPNADMEFRTIRIIHFAALGSLLAMGLVCWLLAGSLTAHAQPLLEAELYQMVLLGLIAVSLGIGALVIAVRPQRPSPHRPPDDRATPLANVPPKTLQILRIAGADAVAMLGLLIFFVNWNIAHATGFIGVAVILMLLTIPRKDDWT